MATFPADDSEKVRIPLPSDEELGENARRLLNLCININASMMFAETDDLFPGVAGLVHAVFEAKGVDPKSRELIILR